MNDLIKIKKYYGENMMHLCRMLFPTLLENEGLLWKIISEKFAYSKLLHDDIVNNHFHYPVIKKFASFNIPTKQILNVNGETVEKTPNISNLIYIYGCLVFEALLL